MKKTALVLAAIAAATGAFAQLSGTYTFGGSTTVAPIAYAAIEQFQKDNPGVKISYEATGSGAGLTAVLAGQITIAGSSADLSEKQLADGALPFVIALDGLSVVVNKNVGIANITRANLAKIYSGAISNWKEVGGKNMAIVAVNRDESSGTYKAFWELVCQKRPRQGGQVSQGRAGRQGKWRGRGQGRIDPPAPSATWAWPSSTRSSRPAAAPS